MCGPHGYVSVEYGTLILFFADLNCTRARMAEVLWMHHEFIKLGVISDVIRSPLGAAEPENPRTFLTPFSLHKAQTLLQHKQLFLVNSITWSENFKLCILLQKIKRLQINMLIALMITNTPGCHGHSSSTWVLQEPV